ncbi:hypothetical protein WMF45_49970 [Sorangium sp. So ce448]|uniref:hypothetical protein n=1 Tax=Sorangium sp. So ce448 TaxID=3133314 RepID=UPI003F63DFF8
MRSANLIIASAITLAAPVLGWERDAHAHEVEMSDLPEGCIDELRAGTLPIDLDLGTLSGSDSSVEVAGFTASECMGYTWLNFKNGTNAKVMTPHYGPNVNSSAFDCNHTALTWGLYFRVVIPFASTSTWVFVKGGNMFGSLVGGTCTYDPENFPHGAGGTSSPLPLTSVPGGWVEYRLAVKAWQHDDTHIGHPGTACGGLTECHNNVVVEFDAP